MTARHRLWYVGLIAALGCHRSIQGAGGSGDGSGGSETASSTATPDTETGQDGEACFLFEDFYGTPYYGKICDGLCRDVRLDRDHCGECRNACKLGEYETTCVEGSCGPIGVECFPPTPEPMTCRQVCADIGHECSEEPVNQGGCGESVWYTINAYDGFDFEDVCVDGRGRLGTGDPPAEISGCDDPILFDYGPEQVAAGCCCRLF